MNRSRVERAEPHVISYALAEPPAAMSYRISQQFAELHRNKHTLTTQEGEFNVRAFADAGLCTLTARPDVFQHLNTGWDSDEKVATQSIVNGCFDVTWNDEQFSLMVVTVPGTYSSVVTSWLAGASQESCEQFLAAVITWNTETHDEVLVFDDEYWQKDARLFQSIKRATLENLVLTPGLKDDIRSDLERFFSSRDLYDRYGVPWRRGILLLGPPGNGKTHAIKALINTLGKTCLYVKSIAGDRPSSSHSSIRRIFERARANAPCILVLEDLDSLITNENRSIFLNELDGFTDNSGIVTLATTNHPDKLDPAIIDRPSRFDRKYHFDLPAFRERRAYLELWNVGMQRELKLSQHGRDLIAALTDGFSFAYLKELLMSSITAWMSAGASDPMDSVMERQVHLLRAQMTSTPKAESAPDVAKVEPEAV